MRRGLAGILAGWVILSSVAVGSAQSGCQPSFPQGALSFADEVASIARGTFGTSGQPGNALGGPNLPGGSVTLGNGGTLTIQFTDNVLTGSGTADPDLYIFESGPIQELVTVEVSKNGTDFFAVGQTTGQCGFIDLDAFGFGSSDRFRFVRVTDIFDDEYRENSSAGAEINAIGAISTEEIGAGPQDPPGPSESPSTDDAYTHNSTEPLVVGAEEGLLSNDEPGAVVIDYTQPNLGRVEVNRNGSFVYYPQASCGTAVFQYTVESNNGEQGTSRVFIEVTGGCPTDTPGEAYAGNGGVATDNADGGAVAVGGG